MNYNAAGKKARWARILPALLEERLIPGSQLTAPSVGNISPREPNAFRPPWTLHTCGAQTHMQPKHLYA